MHLPVIGQPIDFLHQCGFVNKTSIYSIICVIRRKYNAIMSYYEVIIGYCEVIMGYSGLLWVIMGYYGVLSYRIYPVEYTADASCFCQAWIHMPWPTFKKNLLEK